MADDNENDDDAPVLGPELEQIRDKLYVPDKLLMEMWKGEFKAPRIMCRNDDEALRVACLHGKVINLAMAMLHCAPPSHALDEALSRLIESQNWAITAIQAGE